MEKSTIILSPNKEFPALTWREIIERHGPGTTYLLEPGNYTSLGPLEFNNIEKVRVSCPSYREKAFIPNFNVVNSKGFHLENISVGGEYGNRLHKCKNPIIRRCNFRDINLQSGIRIEGGHLPTIQGCYFHQIDPERTKDHVAIQVRGEEDLWGVTVLDCVFHNWADGIQAYRDRMPSEEARYKGNFPDAKIANCQFIVTSDFYTQEGTYAYAENGIDLKGGGIPDHPLVVERCFFWGMRASEKGLGSSSSGEAITIHNMTHDVVVRDVFIGDTNVGLGLYGNKNNKPLERIIATDITMVGIGRNGSDHPNTGKGIIDSGGFGYYSKIRYLDTPIVIEGSSSIRDVTYSI